MTKPVRAARPGPRRSRGAPAEACRSGRRKWRSSQWGAGAGPESVHEAQHVRPLRGWRGGAGLLYRALPGVVGPGHGVELAPLLPRDPEVG